MLIIQNQAQLDAALASRIDDTVKRILLLRGDLTDLATFIVPQAGDTIGDIEGVIGMSVANRHEWVLDHGGAYEAPYIVSDDGSGFVLIVPAADHSNAELLDVLRQHAQRAENIS